MTGIMTDKQLDELTSRANEIRDYWASNSPDKLTIAPLTTLDIMIVLGVYQQGIYADKERRQE